MKGRRALALLICLLCAVLCGCTPDLSGAYEKAITLFASGDYAEAAKAFDRLGTYAQAPTYAAYSHGLVLYAQGQHTAAEPYFAASRSFMYGEERYQYCHAHVLMEAGQYAEAAEALAALSGFEDAALWHAYCAARAAEEAHDYETALFGYEDAGTVADAEDRLYNLRGQMYNRAIALKAEGSYREAIALFTLLGDYLSAADQAVECKDIYQDLEYAQADSLEASGQLQEAYDLFYALSGYRDAARRAEILAGRLGIQVPSGSPFDD